MAIITFVLQLLACIAVIVFILYTVNVHKHLMIYINRLENILNDHQVYLTKEIEFRNSITEVLDKCANILTLCNNTNLEVISKLRNFNKNVENRYNVLTAKFNSIQKEIEDMYNTILILHNDVKNKANNSYFERRTCNNSASNEKRDTKLKTAKNWRYSKENGEDKRNKKQD